MAHIGPIFTPQHFFEFGHNFDEIFAELCTRSFFPGSLSAQFLPMDRYRSTAHFEDFQVRSSLNRSRTDQWFALRKEL